MESPRISFPCITIEYCTQCKWLLRAAYFAQELLSTFSTSLGEVALKPSTGGTFVVEIFYSPGTQGDSINIKRRILWDRKAEGGFPETKELKRRVRDLIDPTRNLGHVDRHHQQSPSTPLNPPSVSFSSSSTHQLPIDSPVGPTEERGVIVPPISKAINRLQASNGQTVGLGERNFTPMDVDVRSRPVSRNGDGKLVNEREIIVVGGNDDLGFCRPGDEDCG